MKYILLIAAIFIHSLAYGELDNVQGTCARLAPQDVQGCVDWVNRVCKLYDSTNYVQCASSSGSESTIQQTWAKVKAETAQRNIQKNAQIFTQGCQSAMALRNAQAENCPKQANNCQKTEQTIGGATVACRNFQSANTSGSLDGCAPNNVCANLACNARRVLALQGQEAPQCATGAAQQQGSH